MFSRSGAGRSRLKTACTQPVPLALGVIAVACAPWLTHTAQADEAGPSTADVSVRDHHVEPRSYGAQAQPDPPRYTRTLSDTGITSLRALDWIDLGADQRTRVEYRDNDFRRPVGDLDIPVLLRVRAYLAVKNALDPFRFTLEVEDDRRFNSQFPRDDRDVNEIEPIQAFAELYFADALGVARPLRLRAGRMAFEAVDRRLIARNEWRNTTNNFQGFRITAGQEKNDWQIDLMALQPIVRILRGLDRGHDEQWFFAAIGDWRGWSDIITLQPYAFWLRQDGSQSGVVRDILAFAVRGYGVVAGTGLDYDFNFVGQGGRHDGQRHRALGVALEAGYTFSHPWSPRVSGFYGFGSGDQDPNDSRSGRFERFFGFARPWSNNDYFQWENLVAPKARVELAPGKRLRLDGGYNLYWLASAADRWNNANLRDPNGASGTFIGQELDARIRGKLLAHLDLTFGYAYFIPGNFTRDTGRSQDSHFAYVEAVVSLF